MFAKSEQNIATRASTSTQEQICAPAQADTLAFVETPGPGVGLCTLCKLSLRPWSYNSSCKFKTALSA